MQLEEADPLSPAPGQLLVRVRAAGVNPVDTYVRAAQFGYSPQLPYTPGADAAGVVEAVGEGVTGFSVGQKVYGGRSLSGSYAEQALFDAGQLYPLADRLSFSQGACIGIPYVTAYVALSWKAQVQPGQTVLIHGASGGVGTAAVQLARRFQLAVIGTAGSPQGRALVEEQGAGHALDHRDPAHDQQILKLTQGRGVDVVLEMLADQNLGSDLTLLAPEGKVVVIGSRGSVQLDPRELMARNGSILGMRLMNVPSHRYREIHAALAEGFQDGTFRPVIGKEFPLAEAAQAHRIVMTPPAYGNVVLLIPQSS